MATTYDLWISSPWGTRLAVVPPEAIESLTYTLTVNAVGALTVTLDRDALPAVDIGPDLQIEVWRRPDDGLAHREGDGPWLLASDTIGLTGGGQRYRKLKAETANTILARRAAMYYANDAGYSFLSGAADDVMKLIVDRNLGTNADTSPLVAAAVWPTRIWSAYLSVDALVTLGPTVTKGFAWRSVLATLQEVAKDAATLLTPVYFDVVAGTTTMLAFRTWVGVRGTDQSVYPNRLVVSPERGSLGEIVERVTDWTDMVTAVTAGGAGQNRGRALGAAYDTTRTGLSPFGLRELFTDATSLTNIIALNAEASSRLRDRRPKKTLSGTLISAPGAVYGVDWGFGDKLIAELDLESFTARVDSVTVEVKGGRETIKAAIKGEAT